MILLKSNKELYHVFGRMINTMGANVAWTGNFVILNHFLILPGNVRSLVMNFDNKKAGTNIIELPDKEEDMEPISENALLANVLNMALYAFGKWGVIKGLKVDQDYTQLNSLFTSILQSLKITPSYRNDNFRFYKDNVQITYEEVVQAALEAGKQKEQDSMEEEEQDDSKKTGLWHNMRWSVARSSFHKEETDAYEKKAARLGNNFYITGYLCPSCHNKLYMSVYPQGKEFAIETEEGRVYLARSYACDSCSQFYTPRPQKLLREGDVYLLKFAKDRNAYEDYLKLLGHNGARVSNCNFNEYASDYGKRKNPPSLEDACANLEQMPEEQLQDLAEKLESGFYPWEKAEPYHKRISALLQRMHRQNKQKAEKASNDAAQRQPTPEKNPGSLSSDTKNMPKHPQDFPYHTADSVKDPKNVPSRSKTPMVDPRKLPFQSKTPTVDPGNLQSGLQTPGKDSNSVLQEHKGNGKNGREVTHKTQDPSTDSNGHRPRTTNRPTDLGNRPDGLRTDSQSAAKDSQVPSPGNRHESNARDREHSSHYASRMEKLDRMSLRQLEELKRQIQEDAQLDPLTKKDYLARIQQAANQKEEEAAYQKSRSCQDKPYHIISRTIDEISRSNCPEAPKQSILEFLKDLRQRRGQQEASQLIAKLPPQISEKQYKAFCSKLAQYEDVDLSAYQAQLDDRRSQSRSLELAGILKRAARSSRSSLMSMLQQIKDGDYPPEEAAPAKEEVEQRIRALDEKAIDEICPDIMGMSFDEAAEAYEKIEKGPFLPELKTDTLEMIDKRLTKLKMDECSLLVEKLKDDVKGKLKDTERLHYYEVRSIMRGDWKPEEAALAAMALDTYASDRNRYEYPILICDTSNKKNGKEGFILTPDHLFYNSTFSSEAIPIRSIARIEGNSGLIGRGLSISRKSGSKAKIPGGVPAKELRAFAEILNRFVSYLQEKPESRSIAYLAKEKHEVKCCYRCGYNYRSGNVCPKCGNQANH